MSNREMIIEAIESGEFDDFLEAYFDDQIEDKAQEIAQNEINSEGYIHPHQIEELLLDGDWDDLIEERAEKMLKEGKYFIGMSNALDKVHLLLHPAGPLSFAHCGLEPCRTWVA